jgi:hypothetical protein
MRECRNQAGLRLDDFVSGKRCAIYLFSSAFATRLTIWNSVRKEFREALPPFPCPVKGQFCPRRVRAKAGSVLIRVWSGFGSLWSALVHFRFAFVPLAVRMDLPRKTLSWFPKPATI